MIGVFLELGNMYLYRLGPCWAKNRPSWEPSTKADCHAPGGRSARDKLFRRQRHVRASNRWPRVLGWWEIIFIFTLSFAEHLRRDSKRSFSYYRLRRQNKHVRASFEPPSPLAGSKRLVGGHFFLLELARCPFALGGANWLLEIRLVQ